MTNSQRLWLSCVALCFSAIAQSSSEARLWKDSTGNYSVDGTMVAFDEVEIIIKLDQKKNGHELLAIRIDQLSEADRRYLESEESHLEMKKADGLQTWKLRNGLTVIAKAVAFGKKTVVLQRRRGKLFVNDHLFDTMPEVYQRMIPKIVEHFDKVSFQDSEAFQNWVRNQKSTARSFDCEGVIFEFANGEEYAFPFFFLDDSDYKMLEPQWEKWKAAEAEGEEQRQHSLYMQSQAAASYRERQQMANVARLQLQLSAVNAGVTDMWEVQLLPGPKVRGYPINVAVFARNSDDATVNALRSNPGYVVGGVARMSRRF